MPDTNSFWPPREADYSRMIREWCNRESDRHCVTTFGGDRVAFIVPRVYGDRTQRPPKLGAILYRAFRTPMSACYERPWEDMRIICRPDQFARFLIWRNEAGLCNGFKELKPELLGAACDGSKVFDVTRARS